jgi:hypothetical protein
VLRDYEAACGFKTLISAPDSGSGRVEARAGDEKHIISAGKQVTPFFIIYQFSSAFNMIYLQN